MKKSLSLLAIVSLLLSMGLVSQVFANAPVYPEVPSVKLYTNSVGLTPAFDLSQFNTAPDGFNADKATGYAISVNFLGKSTLTTAGEFGALTSIVDVAGYSSATDGISTFAMTNAGSTTATLASNKIKYATYHQNEYAVYGLTVGSSVTVPVSSSTAGGVAALAPSFGNPTSLVISDTTKVSAVWSGNTAVVITSLAAAASEVDVDVIASPIVPAGTDQDKERIQIYTNLLANGTFSTANDTTAYGFQAAPGAKTQLASISWVASQADSAGTVANGVVVFTFANANSSIEGNQFSAGYLPVTPGKWYISRMRAADATASNSDVGLLFSFTQSAAADITSDISADVYNGIPTTWTWFEAPVYAHAASYTGNTFLPQFQFKAGAAGSVFVDELQVIQATPKLLQGTRGGIRSFIPGGLFALATSTTLWGAQLYNNSISAPAFTLTSDTAIGSALSVNFAGAAPVPNAVGFEWTYGGAGVITSPATNLGKQFGATLQLDVASGLGATATEVSQALVVAYGVPTQNSVSAALDRIEAAAIVGVLTGGTLTSVGSNATQPYAEIQFGVRADEAGVLNISNVDFISDNNDPNFGNSALFP